MNFRGRPNPLRAAAAKLLYQASGGMVGGTMFGSRALLMTVVVQDEPCTALVPLSL
jgi:hypothetical protein